MTTMRFSIDIDVSRERVWSTLWEDDTFRDWAGLIDEGTYLKGVLEEGKEIEFLSAENGYGVTSLVEKLEPNAFVLFRHSADTQESGQELREKEWTGGTESYTLTERNGVTTLVVVTDIPDGMEEIFAVRLPLALERVKTLAEKKGP
jgi:uncharacterized protein YndB with AHSA1/START domain